MCSNVRPVACHRLTYFMNILVVQSTIIEAIQVHSILLKRKHHENFDFNESGIDILLLKKGTKEGIFV